MVEQVSGVGPIKESIYLECVASTLTEKKTSQKTSFEERGEEKTGLRNWHPTINKFNVPSSQQPHFLELQNIVCTQ